MAELVIAVIILGIALVVTLVMLLTRKPQDYTQSFSLLQQRVNQIEEQVRNSVDAGNKAVSARFEDSLKVIGDVKQTIANVEQTSKQVLEIGKNIASLENLLKPPTARGVYGEFSLGRILSDVLPQRNFKEQYRFNNGAEVDAAIFFGDKIVPVDSKFPLDSFQRCITCADEGEKKAGMREFSDRLTNEIDKIASKYILEDEGTFDFALMYVPSENVYYQTLIKDDFQVKGKSISEYARDKRVVIVSPNTLYAYLSVICAGLRGMQLENNAKQVMESLGRLNMELEKFEKEFKVLGSHIHNAQQTFGRADKQLTVFGDKLRSVETADMREEKQV